MILTPLIGAVENFTVVLNLIRCSISSPHRHGAPVAGIAEVLTLPWGNVAVNVVKHSRPFATFGGIEYPSQKTSCFA